MGILTIALLGLNHVSTPDATASQLLAEGIAPSGENALAALVSVVSAPTSVNAIKALPIKPEAGRFATIADLARNDPGSLAQLGVERYEQQIREYTCVFVKQERINGKLRDAEEIEVRYRNAPRTVYMIWQRNANQAKRVLFQDTAEFVNDKGEKVARVEPAGALIRLIVSDVLMPIRGKRARQSSRRFIDEFGFRSTLELAERYSQLGAERGVLDLRYGGEGEIDGRPTYKIVRYLPYDGPDGIWPDAKMVMHLDQEWLMPTAVYSYADRAGTTLLGSYVHTKVKLNPDLGDSAFEF